MWPLTVYDLPITAAEKMERMISRWLRKWLGMPPSFTRLGLYMRSSAVNLPTRSLVEEFKVIKCRTFLTLRDSKDEDISSVQIGVFAGRRWSPQDEVAAAESRLRHKDLIGAVSRGREGLGLRLFTRWKTSKGKKRRSMVLDEELNLEEEKRYSQAVGLRKQGAWTAWEGIHSRRITAGDLISGDQYRLSFLLRSVYDVLQSPTNLKVWGKIEDDTCGGCGGRCTLEHVLSCCKTALVEGKYKWRHDKILKSIAHGLDQERRKVAVGTTGKPLISFCREGVTTKKKELGMLATADDWQMVVDVGPQAVFPYHIVMTTLMPDLVLWSDSTRTAIIVEPTVPWESRMSEANERKRLKYSDLSHNCPAAGWRCFCIPVEIRCRGFIGKSMWKLMKFLGISAASKKNLVQLVVKSAEEATSWLWLKRDNRWHSK